MFPTGVGMARFVSGRGSPRPCVPHRRGDGPLLSQRGASWGSCSPQAWGWPEYEAGLMFIGAVFPTGVGMARRAPVMNGATTCVPHRRGDGPPDGTYAPADLACSPQAWGWPTPRLRTQCARRVFPTGVGMARRSKTGAGAPSRVPHRRGDGPNTRAKPTSRALCSPQAWGWPAGDGQRRQRFDVFPTGVGMARLTYSSLRSFTSVPHRRGDGPPQMP